MFEIAKGSNTITILASFNGTNGENPSGDVALDSQGNLYGNCESGGPSGDGTVFEITKGSNTITTLASFNGTNGRNPSSGVVLDGQGNLYSTARFGGASSDGTVFEIANGSNTITTLASFNGTNGIEPYGGVALDSQGNLYGTTVLGGAFDGGTVFKIAKGSNTITTLASFNGANGDGLTGGVALDSQGDLYGTASAGGAANDGTVFELSGVTGVTSPSSVFVNSTWAYDASGTPVMWTDGSTHYVGEDAFGTMQAGINGVAAGGTVNVAAGTYNETDTIAQNVTINGAGASLVTVNGQAGGSVFTVDSGVTATLSGLTITGGRAAGGGGIDNNGTLTVTNCTIEGNSADAGGGGGGILNHGGTLTVAGSTFSYGSATGSGGSDTFGGGGLSNTDGGSATVTDCSFSENSATGGYAAGGAIYNDGVMTITGGTFSANTTDYVGGAIANGDGQQHTGYGLTIDDCTIAGNSASIGGGGIYNNSATLTVAGSSIDDNVGQYAGGGIDNLAGTVTVTSGTISGNSCSLYVPSPSYSTGGGIFSIVGGSVTVEGVTISDNSAGYGGGIANSYAYGQSGGTLSIIDSTVAGNSASLGGGGIAAYDTVVAINDSTIALNTVTNAGSGGGLNVSDSTTTLDNTIVAMNTSGTGTSADDIDGTVSSASAYNLIGTGGSGGLTNGANGNQVGVAHPGLDPNGLQNNGGLTATIALEPGSPALDAGSNALAVDANGNPLQYDQRGPGYPRIVNGTVDIGAFEYQGSPFPAPTLTSISPSAVAKGYASPITLTVNGSNFVSWSVVDWNTTALATTYVSSTELTATVPASDFASAGNASISVTNPTPGGGASSSLTFQVLAAPASVFVNSTWASDAPGTAVTWTDGSTHYVGEDAFGTIQAGVDGVASGGTVNVAAGTYTETDTIAQNVTIDGAGFPRDG